MIDRSSWYQPGPGAMLMLAAGAPPEQGMHAPAAGAPTGTRLPNATPACCAAACCCSRTGMDARGVLACCCSPSGSWALAAAVVLSCCCAALVRDRSPSSCSSWSRISGQPNTVDGALQARATNHGPHMVSLSSLCGPCPGWQPACTWLPPSRVTGPGSVPTSAQRHQCAAHCRARHECAGNCRARHVTDRAAEGFAAPTHLGLA